MESLFAEVVLLRLLLLLLLLLMLFAELVVAPLLACDIMFSTRDVVSRTTFDRSMSGRSSVV